MKRKLFIITLILPLLISSESWSSSLPECQGSPVLANDMDDLNNQEVAELMLKLDEVLKWNNCQGIIKFPDNEKYIGEFKGGGSYGQGTFTYATGDKYVGEWKDDKSHGQGTYKFLDGRKYVGEFIDGYKNGQGTFTFLNGAKYVGEYKDDKMNGQGTFTIPDLGKYIGEWKDDKMHGQGTYTLPDGTKQEGIYKDGNFLYENIVTSKEDFFSSNLPQCKGSPADMSNILDVLSWNNCQGTADIGVSGKYVGEWKDSQTHGQGILTIPDGDKVFGEFNYGKLHGQGNYTFANGDEYVGEFKDDLLHGQGTFTYANGTKKEGIWKDGNFLYENITSLEKNKNNDEKLYQVGSGTGFAISYEGYIITNNHVIEGCQDIKINHQGETKKIFVVATDNVNDIALMKTNITPKIVYDFAEEDAGMLSDIIVAGYPFGLSLSSSVKVTKGIVSSLSGVENNYSVMQIDAALQPGNSGGPIINENGNIVGVVVSKLDALSIFNNFGVYPENINFGIKASVVKNLLRSNNIDYKIGSNKILPRAKLVKLIDDGTYYLSCYMTTAQVSRMKANQNNRVFFKNFN